DLTPARGGPATGRGGLRCLRSWWLIRSGDRNIWSIRGMPVGSCRMGRQRCCTAPFTLILKRVCPEMPPAPLRLKIDPGSRTTGLAVVDDGGGQVVWAAELAHRGEEVKHTLEQRRGVRRSRRQRHTRYRPARFRNRKRTPGWQPPSRLSRVQNVLTWVERL